LHIGVIEGKHNLRGRKPFPLILKRENLQIEEELQTQGELQTWVVLQN